MRIRRYDVPPFRPSDFCALRTSHCLPLAALFLGLATSGCYDKSNRSELPPEAEAVSLLGDTLYPPTLPDDVRKERRQQLAEAQADFDRNSDSADVVIWLGRRMAYLGRYRDAIGVYSTGMSNHPSDPRLYRHRGHRFITTRRFDQAIEDLEYAARLTEGRPDEIEPDGLPNPRKIPTSTLKSNIWYHLGLAYYLSGDFERALEAYRQCMKVSDNPDMLVATSHWLYMTLRRLDMNEEAAQTLEPIDAGMDIMENHSYHRLLLMYKGELTPESLLLPAEGEDAALQNATLGYGVGNWHLYNGRVEEAESIFRDILTGPQWAAFGYIAAEAEVRRK